MKDYVPREGTPWEGTPYVISGTCKCGHGYADHHDGGLAKSLGGSPAECEFYGSNELGGLMPINYDPPGACWVVHCVGYVDIYDPDPERQQAWGVKY